MNRVKNRRISRAIGSVILCGVLATFSSGCATYAVAKEKVLPGLKQVVVAAGPDLFKALLEDLSSLLGWAPEVIEGWVGYHGPSDTVPPQPNP